jgi:F-box-like
LANTLSALEELPTEILLHIFEQDSLPASSIQALRQTSSRLRTVCSPSRFATSPSALGRTNKLEFLELLIRDSTVPGLQPCRLCLCLHSPAKFGQFERLKPWPLRDCLVPSELWRCPHKFSALGAGHEVVAHSDQAWPSDWTDFGPCSIDMCNLLYNEEGVGGSVQLTSLKVLSSLQSVSTTRLTVEELKQPSLTSRIKHVFQKLDIPICSHIRLSDPSFIELYDPECFDLQWRSGVDLWMGSAPTRRSIAKENGSKKCPWRCPERSCPTEFWFEVEVFAPRFIHDPTGLLVVVRFRRPIPPSIDVTHRRWVEHVVIQQEKVNVSNSWRTFWAGKLKTSIKSGNPRLLPGSP